MHKLLSNNDLKRIKVGDKINRVYSGLSETVISAFFSRKFSYKFLENQLYEEIRLRFCFRNTYILIVYFGSSGAPVYK